MTSQVRDASSRTGIGNPASPRVSTADTLDKLILTVSTAKPRYSTRRITVLSKNPGKPLAENLPRIKIQVRQSRPKEKLRKIAVATLKKTSAFSLVKPQNPKSPYATTTCAWRMSYVQTAIL